MKKTLFIKNALILTVSSLLLRFAGIIFKVWLASAIGSEGIGLYQLIFGFYMLASTFATSGICTAVTRLVSAELAVGTETGIKRIMRRSIELTLLIAIISMGIIYLSADIISVRLIGDIRSLPALKILPLALPFMGICSCTRGYFIAVRRATPNAISQIAEQIIRIAVILFLVKRYITKGLAICCAAVMAGDIAAESFSCLMLWAIMKADRKNLKRLKGRNRPDYGIVKKILHISLPITSGRYLNTALRTGENLLVPKNLAKFPLSGENALSQFGMIKGMALPILFFPSSLLNSVSTMLIPEISEASVKKQNGTIKAATENVLRLTAVISFIFAAIFMISGEKIGQLIYHSDDVGFLIKALSPIVPLMYLDSIADGILKGLDQQNFSFRVAISDSVLRIILILLILPFTGLKGFIGIMYFSNLLTCLLNMKRLNKVSGVKLEAVKDIFLPICLAATVTLLSNTFLNIMGIQKRIVFVILLSILSILGYFIGLLITGCIKKEEIMFKSTKLTKKAG